MTGTREILYAFRTGIKRLRSHYYRAPYFKRLATIMIAAFCMLVATGIYALGKAIETPSNDAVPETASDVTVPDDRTNGVPPQDENETSPSLLPSAHQEVPGARLDLTNWKIALPVNTDHAGSPDEIKQPELAGFSLPPYFMNNPNGSGVVFRAHADGATTKNSNYPRSELREMTNGGRDEARWSNRSGKHTMTVRQAITHLPEKKSEVVAAQIHDESDDIVMVRLSGERLFVEADGEDIGDLDHHYRLGTPYIVKITAENGMIKISYNNEPKVTYNKSGLDYYFKAGCYTQTNTDKGDRPDAYGEVIIYELYVVHE